MINKNKTRAQLINELQELHQRLIHLEATENECQQTIEEIHQNHQIQNILNKLLHISLEQISIEAMLEQFIDEITSLSWLTLESKGAIFLAGEYAEVLEMKAYRSLNKHLLTMCARVPFGKCLCGRAASFGEILFTDCIDEQHEYAYIGISPHGHYCVPIISGKNVVLGVITLYVKEGHCRNQREVSFLSTVADTLAGIIELKNTQQKLEERGKELDIQKQDLQEVNIALRVLLRKRDEDKMELEENFLINIKQLIKPNLEKLKISKLDERQKQYLTVLETNIDDILSPFTRRLSSRYLNLSASEIRVANLIIDGQRTKEIASLLNVSDKTIEVHRKNIRKKLRLTNVKTNLRAHLLSFQK